MNKPIDISSVYEGQFAVIKERNPNGIVDMYNAIIECVHDNRIGIVTKSGSKFMYDYELEDGTYDILAVQDSIIEGLKPHAFVEEDGDDILLLDEEEEDEDDILMSDEEVEGIVSDEIQEEVATNIYEVRYTEHDRVDSLSNVTNIEYKDTFVVIYTGDKGGNVLAVINAKSLEAIVKVK